MELLILEIRNLRKAADAHHKDCIFPDCEVSLSLLRSTAIRLYNTLAATPEEHAQIKKFLEGWPV